ncbi:chemotaxis protein, partial [Haloarcula sp. AONF1]
GGAGDGLGGVSGETNAEATQGACAAEEQAATRGEVSGQAHDLHERARDLRGTTEEFDVDVDEAARGDGATIADVGDTEETDADTAFTFGADEDPSDAAPASTDGGTDADVSEPSAARGTESERSLDDSTRSTEE